MFFSDSSKAKKVIYLGGENLATLFLSNNAPITAKINCSNLVSYERNTVDKGWNMNINGKFWIYPIYLERNISWPTKIQFTVFYEK